MWVQNRLGPISVCNWVFEMNEATSIVEHNWRYVLFLMLLRIVLYLFMYKRHNRHFVYEKKRCLDIFHKFKPISLNWHTFYNHVSNYLRSSQIGPARFRRFMMRQSDRSHTFCSNYMIEIIWTVNKGILDGIHGNNINQKSVFEIFVSKVVHVINTRVCICIDCNL